MSPKKKTPRGTAEPQVKTEVEEVEADDADEVEEGAAAANKRDGADVSRVTDFAEQKEMDSSKSLAALQSLTNEAKVDREAEKRRAAELAAVSIDQKDVDLIVREMEMEKAEAELKLREHGGDVVKTLNTLVCA